MFGKQFGDQTISGATRHFTAWKIRNPWFCNWFCWGKNFRSQKNFGKKIFENFQNFLFENVLFDNLLPTIFWLPIFFPRQKSLEQPDCRMKIWCTVVVRRFVACAGKMRNSWYYNKFCCRKHFWESKNWGKKIFERKLLRKNIWGTKRLYA